MLNFYFAYLSLRHRTIFYIGILLIFMACVCMCVCVCVRACVRACVLACVCVRACVSVVRPSLLGSLVIQSDSVICRARLVGGSGEGEVGTEGVGRHMKLTSKTVD